MQSMTQAPKPGRPTRPGLLLRAIALVWILVLGSGGCRTMWQKVRESERHNAIRNARTQAQRGQCADALEALDRAQARLDLGGYSRESTLARLRCYEKMGLQELASGHRRLVEDFYTAEPFANPAADGSSVFRVEGIDPLDYGRPPSALKVPAPRYTPYASRSKIVGRVIIGFQLAGNGRPTRLRVLEMPHPLLASWSLEAVAQAGLKKGTDPASLPRDRKFIATFYFQWRWAEDEEEEAKEEAAEEP